MRWNSKTDIIALLIAGGGGFALVGLVVGVAAPIIVSIKEDNIWELWPIPALIFLICSLIYLSRNRKNKKPTEQQKQ